MDALSRDWDLFMRAVEFPNLSVAASHIGVSQSQLSRIIARIERNCGFAVLDRSSKRNSKFTPHGRRLATEVRELDRKFKSAVDGFKGASIPTHVRIGALEGLMEIAAASATACLEVHGVRVVELDLYELDELEGRFLRDELDLIFTAREPGRAKRSRVKTVGWQSLDWVGEKSVPARPSIRLMSGHEYRQFTASRESSAASQVRYLVSNSLATRVHWRQKGKGGGVFPSHVRTGAPERSGNIHDHPPVLAIAQETLDTRIWDVVQKIHYFQSTQERVNTKKNGTLDERTRL